jgi:hypothetical protein
MTQHQPCYTTPIYGMELKQHSKKMMITRDPSIMLCSMELEPIAY